MHRPSTRHCTPLFFAPFLLQNNHLKIESLGDSSGKKAKRVELVTRDSLNRGSPTLRFSSAPPSSSPHLADFSYSFMTEIVRLLLLLLLLLMSSDGARSTSSRFACPMFISGFCSSSSTTQGARALLRRKLLNGASFRPAENVLE